MNGINKTKELHCLIVDDNKEIRQLLSDMLDRIGVFKFIVQAENGIDASIKLRNQKFDIVLSDIQMPKKDGISFLADEISLKTINPQNVIVLSGSFDGDKVRDLVSLGIKKIIVKPLSFDKVKLLITDIVGARL
jgi:two-component system chemotaxis response regulator CheY